MVVFREGEPPVAHVDHIIACQIPKLPQDSTVDRHLVYLAEINKFCTEHLFDGSSSLNLEQMTVVVDLG